MIVNQNCIFLVLTVGTASSVDWCQKGCSWIHKKHLRCEFKKLESNELCSRINCDIRPDLRKKILHFHNTLRDDISRGRSHWKIAGLSVSGWDGSSKPAANMRQMVWNYELEEDACIYGSQCTVKAHKPYDCAYTEKYDNVHMSRYDSKPENLKMEMAFISFVKNKGVIKLYYSERVLISKYVPGPWDNFFAVIFSETYQLGCSKVICGCSQQSPYRNAGTIICLYGPSANFSSNGFRVYKTGKTCSACPNNTSCRKSSTYKYLCARRNDPKRPENIPDLNVTSITKLSLTLLFLSVMSLTTRIGKLD